MRENDQLGWTAAISRACSFCNVEVAQYLHELYPESITISDISGDYALHLLLRTEKGSEDRKELTRHLLLHHQGAVLTPNGAGSLPLHLDCNYGPLRILKLVYDAYPVAYVDETIVG